MDRGAAMLILLGVSVSTALLFLALFALAPILCSCIISLLYTLYLFITNESSGLASGIHDAQEFENRFWTVFAVLFSTALFFARDSPLAFGRELPSLGFFSVVAMGYGMHAWDRYSHRLDISRCHGLRRKTTGLTSLVRLEAAGQVAQVNSCLSDIDQLLIPSTINNIINQRFILRKEREIISIFEEAEPKALNYLIAHAKLGLLFYKIKDHRHFSGQHRTEFIELLAVERISVLTLISRVVVLHALQMMKLPANARAEYWVRNIILSTHQDDLSELKTLMDAKGDYFSMTKLIYDDIRSKTVREDILAHLRKEAAIQEAHMAMGTRKSKRRKQKAWRKVLSDVDDTLTCSAGSYPAGIDKRYGKKVVYPGVLAFYRELDLGATGPEEWPEGTVGNLVFLSARPHIYKDVSEKRNFAKFEKLIARGGADGRGGMHTVPSLLAGDVASGREYIVTNDMEPLALKKFENFKRYVSIYPEYKHVFVCDNGQGDVRAGDLMFDSFPKHVEALYVHLVQDRQKTHGYNPEKWIQKGFQPCFFRTYPEASLHAASRQPPLIKIEGLRRICQDAINDFYMIQNKEWPTKPAKARRRAELNQGLWLVNQFLASRGYEVVPLIEAERTWKTDEIVRTPYGLGKILSFDSIYDMYKVELDWRPLDKQIADYKNHESKARNAESPPVLLHDSQVKDSRLKVLETVVESAEETEEENCGINVGSGNDTVSHVDNNPSLISSPLTPNIVIERTRVDHHNHEKMPPDSSSNDVVPLRQLSSFSKDSTEADYIASNLPLSNGDTGSKDVPSGVLDESLDPLPKEKSGNIVNQDWPHPVIATIQGQNIKKYSPPVLPALPRESRSIFSFWGTSESSKAAGQSQPRPKPLKELDLPNVLGSTIHTPFGEGIVSRPLPTKAAPASGQTGGKESSDHVPTIGISLTSWTLANNSHPMVYCSYDSAKEWYEAKAEKKTGSSLLSVVGSLVSKGLKRMASQVTPAPPPPKPPHFERYYQDGASVSTSFGYGVVISFRESDGFYEVSLVGWEMKGGVNPVAYLQKDWLSYRIANSCHEGYPVLTSLGLSGTLASVEPTTGVHVVTIPSLAMVCYLQPKEIIQPLKASVGEDVATSYGEGKVRKYRIKDDMYEISLTGCSAFLYAKGETFDRIHDGMKNQEGSYGISGLFRYLFFASDDVAQAAGKGRSRSNSVSRSVRSQVSGVST